MIKKIYHISDTHIHLYRKLKQQKQVFENLFKELRDRRDQYSIIVLTGDVFHSKTELSPEAITMANMLFKGLTDIMPTIVIAGNHDANLANQNRLDAITPVVQSLNINNLFYYRDTGWYDYQNIRFWVSSVFDQKLPHKEQFTEDKINILLYHGMVQNVSVNNITLSGKYKIKEFKNFDYVLLGDIHKHQVLNQSPLTAYAGSLMQLNFGEEVNLHGMVQWDIENNKLKHIQVDNDYKYYNIDVQNGQFINIPTFNAKFPRVKIKYKNTTLQRVRQLQKQLKKDYNLQEIMLSKVSDELQLKSSSFKYSLQKLDDIEYQQSLIKEYIQHSDLGVNEDEIKKILELNVLVNKQVKSNKSKAIFNQNLWTIESMEFSNFFSYSENNVIDFKKFNGVVGITGANRSGKSSIIQIILFMLYDRTSKTNKTLSVLNKLKTQLFGKIVININGRRYYIQKSGKLNNKGDSLPIKIKFYTYDQLGDEIDLSGTQRSDTNAIIKNYIGTYQDAIATFFSTQKNENAFIEMTSANRKSQLNSLFNLNLFDDCHKYINQESKQLKGYFKNINIDKHTDRVDNCTMNNKLIVQQNQDLQGKVKQLTTQVSDLDHSLKSLIQQRQKITDVDENVDIVIIQKQIDKLSIKISDLNRQQQECKKLLIQNDQNVVKMEQMIKDYNADSMIKKKDDLYNELNILNKLKNQLSKKDGLYKKSLKQIELLSQVQYDQNCEYCMNNPLTKNAIQQKKNINNIEKQVEQINNKLLGYDELNNSYLQIEDELRTYDNQVVRVYNDLLKKSNELNNKITTNASLINKFSQDRKRYSTIANNYRINEKIIEQNKALEKKIHDLQIIEKTTKEEKKLLEDKLFENKLNYNNNKVSIESSNQIINQYNEKLQVYKITQLYKTIMSRNGLQYYIITNIVSSIQKQMNEVLHTFANFSVEFSMDGSSLDINIIYPDKEYQIQLCSGFERFMVSIALRHTLSVITNKSKSKMFVIDEGFGVLDGQNVLQFDKIFEFISNKYQTLLLISHLDVMRSMLEDTIQIQYKNGESKIL